LIIFTLATLRLHIQDVPEFNDIVEEQLSLEFVRNSSLSVISHPEYNSASCSEVLNLGLSLPPSAHMQVCKLFIFGSIVYVPSHPAWDSQSKYAVVAAPPSSLERFIHSTFRLEPLLTHFQIFPRLHVFRADRVFRLKHLPSKHKDRCRYKSCKKVEDMVNHSRAT